MVEDQTTAKALSTSFDMRNKIQQLNIRGKKNERDSAESGAKEWNY